MNKHKANQKARRVRGSISRKETASHEDLSLKTYMQDSHALAPRLQRLVRDIVASSEKLEVTRSSCDECERLIEFYVDAEKRGEEVHAIFPFVWKHLKTCVSCQTSYQLLSEVLDTSSIPDFDAVPVSAPPLPFLVPATSNAQWIKRVRSRVEGAPINFGLIIQAAHLRQQLSTSQPGMYVRGEPASAKKALVLSDTISLGDRDVAVKMWAQRLGSSAFVRIELLLASSTPLPDPLRVKFTLNNYEHSGLIHGSQYSFDEFPVSALEGDRDLRVEFEAGDSLAVVIEEHGSGDVG